MFEKNLKICLLLDFYGDVLDEHCGAIMRAYYEDDLSLSEIAEGEGISRQGVRHVIKKGEEQLLFLEEKLGLCAHYAELERIADALGEMAKELPSSGVPDADRYRSVLEGAVATILNKGN